MGHGKDIKIAQEQFTVPAKGKKFAMIFMAVGVLLAAVGFFTMKSIMRQLPKDITPQSNMLKRLTLKRHMLKKHMLKRHMLKRHMLKKLTLKKHMKQAMQLQTHTILRITMSPRKLLDLV